MKTFIGLARMKQLKNSAVCLGVFDGVHLGHQKIITKTVQAARRLKIKSVAVTFDPHPAVVLAPKAKHANLYSLHHRLSCFDRLGVDHCFVIPFNRNFAKRTRDNFIQKVLLEKLGARHVFTGDNYRFGRGAAGDFAYLAEQGKVNGFKATRINSVTVGGTRVSTTRIKHLLSEGKLKQAEGYLGRPVSLLGQVIHGKARGRKMGIRTANLKLEHEYLPPSGVYVVKSKIGGRWFRGALHLGPRPTFGEKRWQAEVHFIGLHKSLYNRQIELILIKKLRDIQKFKSEKSLKSQILKDLQKSNER
jgi:riboflavin kinase/FMN adenylyltransferase